jgi:DNA-binding CsgD family transcriptional regulator
LPRKPASIKLIGGASAPPRDMADPAQPPGSPHSSTPAELVARIEAEREGGPFLLYRDGDGNQRIFALRDSASRLSVGRTAGADLRIDWDDNVSRVHAELASVGAEWTISDEGLSRNGSYINGERVAGRRRLRDGDAIRVGETTLVYRAPGQAEPDSTALGDGLPTAAQVSPARRRVLIALARPFRGSSGFSTPASNRQIADELYLSVEAVKTHLRGLFELFEIQHLPQNQKRTRLVERAFLAGVISERDLTGSGG